jgi:hypothetical protein
MDILKFTRSSYSLECKKITVRFWYNPSLSLSNYVIYLDTIPSGLGKVIVWWNKDGFRK